MTALNFVSGLNRLGLWVTAVFVLASVASAQQPTLSAAPAGNNGWFELRGWAVSNQVYTLTASSNLLAWVPIAVLQHVPFIFADPASQHLDSRFYRLTMSPRTEIDDWKNQIQFPDDPFLSSLGDPIYWVKFAILVDQPNRVFFQDSGKYPFHYNFAVTRLEPFRGMTPEEFGKASQWPKDQRVILGTVIFGPRAVGPEFGVQFSGKEPYPPDSVAEWFELVKSAVNADRRTKALYMPTFEQADTAERNRSFFLSKGIAVSSVDRWLNEAEAVCYSYGWAIGRLVYVPATAIDLAYADGRLRPEDILLTDGAPAEISFVAGLVTLSPSTPNSHVAILARSYSVPFIYPTDALERDRIKQLAGRKIFLRATRQSDRPAIKLFDVDDKLESDLEADILKLKRPGPVRIASKARYGAISAPVNNLAPSDIQFFGGKAANFGLLRRTIPGHSPDAIAFSFDLWDDFLEQRLASGRSLRGEIGVRLGSFSYPPDIAALRNSLAGLRDLITRTARFSEAQKQAILGALAAFKFEPQRKIRFRSSTNVEDAEQFTGAGLYDSFSGCLADDLDGDESGPCGCDPTEANERGVLRAIQKVYASFYNDNAFLERLRFGLDESRLGMALLAHYSFPDEIELANGVATVGLHHFAGGIFFDAEIVTQLGAVSVTNPGGDALPERVRVENQGLERDFILSIKEGSSLLPLGGKVLGWPQDYRTLMNLFTNVAIGYTPFVPAGADFLLDFEFKKIQPGQLVVKQVRQVPVPKAARLTELFLIDEPSEYSVNQDEVVRDRDDIFVTHRLKSRWKLQTRNLRLTPTNLATSFYAEAELEYLDGTEIKSMRGRLPSWPNAGHSAWGPGAEDWWTLEGTGGPREFRLTALLRPFDPGWVMPILSLSDYALSFAASEAGIPTGKVQLVQRPASTTDSYVESITVTKGNVSILTTVRRSRRNAIPYSPSFVAFKETRIQGLTSQPIVLQGYYSQTKRVHLGAHNSWDEFLFEPQQEPQLPPALSQELKAANIRYLRVYDPAEIVVGYYTPNYKITLIGFDGSTRGIE